MDRVGEIICVCIHAVLLYAGVGLMAFADRLAAWRHGPWPALCAIAAVITHAITAEFHKHFLPGRRCSAGDVARNFLGAPIAPGTLHLEARRGRGSKERAIADPSGRIASDLLLAGGIAALAFLLYLPALGFDFTNWDDPHLVMGNPRIHGLSWQHCKLWWTEVYSGNYMPLTLASFALDHALWKLDPFGYHLQNLLLHAGSSALFALVLLRLGAPAPVAALGAAIFAIHPAQVESVAWVAERSAVLAMFFLMASFLAYAHATRGSPPRGTSFLLSFGLFVAALLSKVIVVTFPAVLFLYDLGYRREPKLRMLLGKTPFLLAAVVVAAIGYRGQVSIEVTTREWLGGTPGLHVATIAGLFARYARILLFPTNLSTLYDPPDARSAMDPWPLAGYALLVLGAWGAWRALRRERRALWWMGMFWLSFLPVAQIITYKVHMADRYLYLPSVGFAAAAATGVAALEKRTRAAWARGTVVVAVGIALACLTLLTLARERVWRDPMSLWADTVRKPPVHWAADYNYAKTLADQGDIRAAIPYYERALTKTDSISVITNLGNAYARIGELGRAEALLRRAAGLPQAKPEERALAADNLGEVMERRGRMDAAILAYHAAIRTSPRDPIPRIHLARALRALGRPREARLRFEEVLAIAPNQPDVEIGLAALEIDEGRTTEARRRLDAVIARRPLPEALLERARASRREGRVDEARADLDRALDLAPPGPLHVRIRKAMDELADAAPGIPSSRGEQPARKGRSP